MLLWYADAFPHNIVWCLQVTPCEKLGANIIEQLHKISSKLRNDHQIKSEPYRTPLYLRSHKCPVCAAKWFWNINQPILLDIAHKEVGLKLIHWQCSFGLKENLAKPENSKNTLKHTIVEPQFCIL